MSDQITSVRFYALSDVDRVLRLLYQGTRPAGVRFLICACGRIANLTQADTEAIGWQVLPHPVCPGCQDPEPYRGPARERFMALVDQLAKAS